MNKHIILSIFLSTVIFLSGCANFPLLEENTSATLANQTDISTPVAGLLLDTMYKNRNVCVFNVSSKEEITINDWIKELPGLTSLHCSYINMNNSFNVTANLEYWDNYPIVYAFKNGNTSYLNERQLTLYNEYCRVLNTVTKPSNSEIANELAIHDYIIENTDYILDEYKYAAYDALINKKAVCAGYAEVFQTFMDMLGIPCLYVTGQGIHNNKSEPHAWNMVKLDNEWYCVDVTWDDPIGSNNIFKSHNYFNISLSDMNLDHMADNEATLPETNSTDFAYYNFLNYDKCYSPEDITATLNKAIKENTDIIYIYCEGFEPDLQEAVRSTKKIRKFSYTSSRKENYTTYSIRLEQIQKT